MTDAAGVLTAKRDPRLSEFSDLELHLELRAREQEETLAHFGLGVADEPERDA